MERPAHLRLHPILLPGLCLAAACVAALALLPAPARAADASPCSLLEGVLSVDAADSLATLLPARAKEAIDADMSAAEAAASAADADLQKAKSLLGKLKARIEIRKGEIEALKGRAKLAKEQNNDADQQALKAQQDAEELQLDLLKSASDLRSAEMDLAETRRKAADARVKFLEQERDCAARQAELAQQGASGSKLVALQTGAREALKQALSALKDLSDRSKDAGQAESNVVDKRMKVFEAQAAIAGP
jgi:chromosome segregation ATPase